MTVATFERQPSASWPPPVAEKPKPQRDPRVRASSVHRAAGSDKQPSDRPDWAVKELTKSWESTDTATKADARATHAAGDHWVHFEDSNAPKMQARDFHPEAVMLYQDRPDNAIVVPAPGWRLDRDHTRHLPGPQLLRGEPHQAHRVRIVFVEVKTGRRQIVRVGYANIGRTDNDRELAEAWEIFAGFTRACDIVLPLEVGEGDKQNEPELLRRNFPVSEYKRFYVKEQRNPVLVARDVAVVGHSNKLVGQPVKHFSPPRRYAVVIVEIRVLPRAD